MRLPIRSVTHVSQSQIDKQRRQGLINLQVYYCNKECQRKGWSSHKQVCVK